MMLLYLYVYAHSCHFNKDNYIYLSGEQSENTLINRKYLIMWMIAGICYVCDLLNADE